MRYICTIQPFISIKKKTYYLSPNFLIKNKIITYHSNGCYITKKKRKTLNLNNFNDTGAT